MGQDLGLVWGRGRKDKRPGLERVKDCALLGKVEQTRSESQTPGGGEDTAARPVPGPACRASDCPEMGPIIGHGAARLEGWPWPWTGGRLFATMGRASWVKGRPCALGNAGNEVGSPPSLARSVEQNSDCVC
jgi:hypothetical protein